MFIDIVNVCWFLLNMANGACSKDGRKNIGTFSHTFNLYFKKNNDDMDIYMKEHL